MSTTEPLADVMRRYSGNKYEYHGCDKDRARLADAFCDLVPGLVAACNSANDAMCRATFPGARDRKDLNYVIDKCRAALAKAKEAGVST